MATTKQTSAGWAAYCKREREGKGEMSLPAVAEIIDAAAQAEPMRLADHQVREIADAVGLGFGRIRYTLREAIEKTLGMHTPESGTAARRERSEPAQDVADQLMAIIDRASFLKCCNDENGGLTHEQASELLSELQRVVSLARRERSEPEPLELPWTPGQILEIGHILAELDIDDADIELPLVWQSKLTSYVESKAQTAEHKREVRELKAFAGVSELEPEPSDADVCKWSAQDRDTATAAYDQSNNGIYCCTTRGLSAALDAVQPRLVQAYEAGRASADKTIAEQHAEITHLRESLEQLGAERGSGAQECCAATRIEALKEAAEMSAPLHAVIRDLKARETVFLSPSFEILEHKLLAAEERIAELEAQLAQHACGSAPEAAAEQLPIDPDAERLVDGMVEEVLKQRARRPLGPKAAAKTYEQSQEEAWSDAEDDEPGNGDRMFVHHGRLVSANHEIEQLQAVLSDLEHRYCIEGDYAEEGVHPVLAAMMRLQAAAMRPAPKAAAPVGTWNEEDRNAVAAIAARWNHDLDGLQPSDLKAADQILEALAHRLTKPTGPVAPHEYSDEQVNRARNAASERSVYVPSSVVRDMLAAASVPAAPADAREPVQPRETVDELLGSIKGGLDMVIPDDVLSALHELASRARAKGCV